MTMGGGMCTTSTCEELNADCGYVTDTKCGGVVQCGTKCKTGEVCGGMDPNQCGVASGGGKTCVVDPATTARAAATLAVKRRTIAATCSTAVPRPAPTRVRAACRAPANRRAASSTPPPLALGSATPAVRRRTTAATCSRAALPAGDSRLYLRGGGSDAQGKPIPGVCGCTGACSLIPDCGAGKTTTLSGKVYDPAGEDPLYHVLVYIANDPTDPALTSFPKGITCDVCGASAAGSPLISDPTLTDPPAGTYTGVDGSFTLQNVPVGKALTLVIQLGRWRRVFKVDVTKSCDANTIPDQTLLMPSSKAQGDIPLMAMVTGDADSLECVLRQDGHRVDGVYRPGRRRPRAVLRWPRQLRPDHRRRHPGPGLPVRQCGQQAVIDDYDMVILACQGDAYTQTAADLKTLRTYADQGGRVFSTHYSYVWLTKNDETAGAPAGTKDNWSEVAKWHVDENDRAGSAIGIIDKVSNPKAAAFQGWLEAVKASTVGSGTIGVNVIRHDSDLISAVTGQTQQWLYRDGDNAKSCSLTGGTCESNANCTAKVCQANTGMACPLGTECSAMACNNGNHGACTQNNQCGGNGRCVANPLRGQHLHGQRLPEHQGAAALHLQYAGQPGARPDRDAPGRAVRARPLQRLPRPRRQRARQDLPRAVR